MTVTELDSAVIAVEDECESADFGDGDDDGRIGAARSVDDPEADEFMPTQEGFEETN